MSSILSIYNHYVTHTIVTFDITPRPLSYISETHQSVLAQSLPYLVAIDKNDTTKVLGYAYATQSRPRAAWAATVEFTIYLSPDATGQGVGKCLLDALLRKLREVPCSELRPWGVREVLAVAVVQEGDAAGRFYRREGFREVGTLERVGWKMGGWVDVRCWQLSLRGEDDSSKAQEM